MKTYKLAKRSNKGFGIAELVVSIGIISVLMVVLLPSVSKAINSNKAVVFKSEMTKMENAVAQFEGETGRLPLYALTIDGSSYKNKAWALPASSAVAQPELVGGKVTVKLGVKSEGGEVAIEGGTLNTLANANNRDLEWTKAEAALTDLETLLPGLQVGQGENGLAPIIPYDDFTSDIAESFILSVLNQGNSNNVLDKDIWLTGATEAETSADIESDGEAIIKAFIGDGTVPGVFSLSRIDQLSLEPHIDKTKTVVDPEAGYAYIVTRVMKSKNAIKKLNTDLGPTGENILTDPAAALAKANRVLKTGTIVFIPHSDSDMVKDPTWGFDRGILVLSVESPE